MPDENQNVIDNEIEEEVKIAGEEGAEQEAEVKDKVDPEEDGQPKVEPEKVVKLAALHESRSREKQAKRELRETREQMKVLEGRFQQYLESGNRQEQPKAPSLNDDPVEFVNHLATQVGEVKQFNAQQQQFAEQQKHQQQLISKAKRFEAEFVEENPDYYDAYQHFAKIVQDQAPLFGVSAQELELRLVATAIQNGDNPADYVYRTAKSQGYKKKSSDPDKLDVIAKGQEASRSLSQAGGKPAGGAGMSVQDLLKMSPSEFDAYCAKNPAKVEKLMGR